MFKALLLKEWLQHRWELGFGLFMLMLVNLTMMTSGMASQGEAIVVICFFGGLILALSNAMGVMAPERSGDTWIFLRSRPVSPWKIFAAKWLTGWLNTIIPPLACGLLLIIVARQPERHFGRSMANEMRLYWGMIPLVTMFYHLTVCLAPRKAAEGLTTITAIAVGAGIFFHGLAITPWISYPHKTLSLTTKFFIWLNPLNFIGVFIVPKTGLTFWIIQLIIFSLACVIGLRKCKASS